MRKYIIKNVSFGIVAASLLVGCAATDERESVIDTDLVEKEIDFQSFEDKKARLEIRQESSKIYVKNKSITQIFKMLNHRGNKTHYLEGDDIILPNTNYSVESVQDLMHYVSMLTDKRLVKDLESDTIVKWKLVSYEDNPFSKNFEISYDSDQVNVKSILKEVSKSTGYSLIYNKNVIDTLTDNMRLEFHGKTLNEFVDYISKYYNINIEVDHKYKTINISKYKYMVFDVIVPTSNLSLSKTMASGGTSAGFGSGSVQTSSQELIDIYQELDTYLSLLIKQDQSIINKKDDINENSYFIQKSNGKVFVNAEPETLKRVTEIINEYKENLETTINVSVAIYTVELNKNSMYGIDWQAISNSAQGFLTAGTSSNLLTINPNNATPSGNLVQTVLPTNSSGSGFLGGSKTFGDDKMGINAVLNMASTYGEMADISKFSISLINNFPVTQVISEKIPYLSEIKNEIVAGKDGANDTVVTTPTFETIDSGIFFYINAKTFKDSDKIMIDIAPQFSKLQGFETINYGNGESSSQPQTAVETYNNNIIINDGDKVILTGIITNKSSKSYSGMDITGGGMYQGLDALTGNNGDKIDKREIFIVLQATKNK